MISDGERRALEAYLTSALELEDPCRIAQLERLAAGQSRAMYRLELEWPVARCDTLLRRTVIVRVEQWGLLGTDSADEVRTMRAMRAAGYPVAEVLAYDPTTEVLAQPFFVMEFIEGSNVVTPESLEEYVLSLDRLHRMDPDALELDFLERPRGPRDAALRQVERWYGIYRWGLVGEPSPLAEEAAEWLRCNAPESRRTTVVHGDPGPGNYLHRDGHLASVVDWEFAHIGDPDEDWAYLISMRGATVMSEEEWIGYIERVAGVQLDRERLRYWQALNYFKSVCIDQTALKLYMEGRNPAPNMLAIGTAIHLAALKSLSEVIV
jgi:aminoglycoside phosphotransferase (APT) family kinase protein